MNAETKVLELPAELYAELQELAKAEQTDMVAVLAQLIALAKSRHMRTPNRAFRRILEQATDLGVSDLSEQHDRYLYGDKES
jgi:hypothetical protein